MTATNTPRQAERKDAPRFLAGIVQTGKRTLIGAAPVLMDVVIAQLNARLEKLNEKNLREVNALAQEVHVHRAMLEEGLRLAVMQVIDHGELTLNAASSEETKIEIMDKALVETHLERVRTAQKISQALEWELADLNTRVSYLQGVKSVDDKLNPISPTAMAKILYYWMEDSPLSPTLRQLFKETVLDEFTALVLSLYHEINAWLIKDGVLAKIDLREMVVRTAGADRWRQISAQSMLDWQQPKLEQAVAEMQQSRMSGSGNTGMTSPAFGMGDLMSIPHSNNLTQEFTPEQFSQMGIAAQQDGGIWNKLKAKLTDKLGAAPELANRFKADGKRQGGETPFDITILQLLDHVETQLLSTLPTGDVRGMSAKAAASLPRLVQFREEMQAAASSANERATVEMVALMFEHILTDESILPLARILFARLQIPVLRVAIRENDEFLEASHPARDFIDRLASVVSGYSGEDSIDDRLKAEIRRLVFAAEKTHNISGQFFSQLLYDFELFLNRYGRELREVSVLGVPILEETEDFKVTAVLYTIELRKLTDDVPCDKRVRDFLLHSWVSVMSSISAKYGKDSVEVAAGLRLAADLVWCGVPKANVQERTEQVSELPLLMRRVEVALADAGAAPDAQKKASTRLRSMLLQIIRSPAHQSPDIVFDALLAKLQQFEQSAVEASERSTNYRIPLATLRSQITARSLSLQVIEPGDLKLPADSVASNMARQWAETLKLGSWYRVEMINHRPQLLQLAWISHYRNYLLFAEQQGTSGMVTEPNTIALLVERGLFKPVERESLTSRATKSLIKIVAAQA